MVMLADRRDVPPIHTPTSVNQEIRGRVADMRQLRVRGEVTGVRVSGGHMYFQLKDAGATLRCTAWRSTVAQQRLQLREGQEVICHGAIDLWVRGGSYALIISRVEEAGTGALWAAFERLKAALEQEGLFDPGRKRPLPFLPRTVGIVTAPTGAALRDMIRVLHERFPVRILLAPARVQGEGAAETIASAIELLDGSGLCDVIIVGRGGGSMEDLWAFNEERTVRAVADCRTPIVSAVGHETDTLLSDHAADRRAPTPTAAAEMVVPRLLDLLQRIAELRGRMTRVLARQLTSERRHLRQLAERLGSGEAIAGHRRRELDDLGRRLGHAAATAISGRHRRLQALRQRLLGAHPARRLAARRRLLTELNARLHRRAALITGPRRQRLIRLSATLAAAGHSGRLTAERRQRLARLDATLRALSPRAALERGYAILRRPATGRALTRAGDAEPGELFDVLLGQGSLKVRVEQIEPGPGASATPGQSDTARPGR